MTKYTDVMRPQDISIKGLWAVFESGVLSGAPQMQRDEMRKSFYAGFVECFKIMTDLSSELPEAETVAVLERLSEEAQQFYEAMMRQHPPSATRR